ncbi:kinase-like protein [Martensiomyces pterosporus]|nr:kinase-like protein [Martensiomyces pterosporus]
MDDILYKGLKLVPNFSTDNLAPDKLYTIEGARLREIEGYTLPTINNSNGVEELFSKVLYSYHEVECYEKLRGLGIAPEMKGLTKIQGCYVLLLEKMEPLRPHQVDSKIIRALIEKVKKMHSAGVVHRDLRMSNLLYKDGDVFLCDFEDKGYSPEWAAPEVLQNMEFSCESDMYSLGCTILELATGHPPWHDDDDFESNVVAGRFDYLLADVKTPLLKDIIRDCLIKRCCGGSLQMLLS